jgi:SAM-dependent methyltransferase
MKNRYGRLGAVVYDLDKPIGRSFGDIEFYKERLTGCEGAILEPAVGNGRVLIPLLEAGFAVEGFDRSEEMLQRCRAHCAHRQLSPRLQRMRFEDFSYEQPFEAIVVPAGSFQLVDDFDEALAVLRRFRDHLKPSGRVIVDLAIFDGAHVGEISVRSWTTAEGDLVTLEDRCVEIDPLAQRIVWHLRYDLWRDSRLVESEIDRLALRWWGVHELTMALEQTGFGDVAVSGGHRHACAPHKSDQLVAFEATRA